MCFWRGIKPCFASRKQCERLEWNSSGQSHASIPEILIWKWTWGAEWRDDEILKHRISRLRQHLLLTLVKTRQRKNAASRNVAGTAMGHLGKNGFPAINQWDLGRFSFISSPGILEFVNKLKKIVLTVIAKSKKTCGGNFDSGFSMNLRNICNRSFSKDF